MPDRIKPIDFESTVQLDLSKLNPYSQESESEVPVESYGMPDSSPERDVAFNNPNPATVEISVSDLSAELDALADEFSFPDLADDPSPRSKQEEVQATTLESTVTLSTPPIPQKPTAPQAPKAVKAKPVAAQKVAKKLPQASKAPAEIESSSSLLDLTEELLEQPMPSKPEKAVKNTPTPPPAKKMKSKLTPPHTASQAIPQVETSMITTTPAKSNSTFAILLGIIGLIAGGSGAWIASNANIEIMSLQRQVQSLETQFRTHLRNSITKPVTQTKSRKSVILKTTDAENIVKSQPAIMEQVTTKTITPATPIAKSPVKKSGPWVVIISSHQSKNRAQKEQRRLNKMGVQTTIQSSTVKKRLWYRIVSPGFASKKEAYAHVNTLKTNNAVKGAWVSKTKG